MTNTEKHETTFLHTMFGDVDAYSFNMTARDLIQIYYVAVRGQDDEEGAVQRILNKRRISSIKEYILEGNTFFNSFIINWTEEEYKPKVKKHLITIPLTPSSAQMIDGQHRIAGLAAAMEEDDSIGDQSLIVTMCLGLSTQQAAKIFLNINTEQKPVPKSLIFDLFGEVYDDENHALNRATDIARELNEDPKSSLYKLLKFPGSPRGSGSIELSSFVAAYKEHLKPAGTFHTYKIKTLDKQKLVINNFYQAIKNSYQKEKLWSNKSQNPFLKAAGFNGSVDYFTHTLIAECAKQRSFKVSTIESTLNLNEVGLLKWDEVKGLDGKSSRKKIKDYLDSNRLAILADKGDYEF